MKKFLLLFFLFIGYSLNGQVVMTQTFIDKCSGELKIATTTYVNGNAVVLFYNQIKTFTPAQVQSGELQIWLQQTYLAYNSTGCPTNIVVQQTVQQTVNQAVQQAASAAATQAASAAANQAASTAASTAASSTASTAATSTAVPTTTPVPSQSTTTTSTQSSSTPTAQSEGNSSSETKSETKSESKSETKKESKKEERKKNNEANPLLFGSDLSLIEGPDRNFNAIISLGLSKSSLMGNESYSVNSMIWSTFKQFALSGGYTRMSFDMGKLKTIHSYSMTSAYLSGNYMGLVGYTHIKPNPKYGTYGFNVGIVSLFIKTDALGDGTKELFNTSLSSSLVTFWTKPYQVSKKLTLSPQIFIMSSPIGYAPSTGQSTVNKDLGFLIGSSFDYRISKRFGFTINYKAATSTVNGSPVLSNFLIGSRLML
jgi:hypothetical protein